MLLLQEMNRKCELGRVMRFFDSDSAWCLGELDTPAGIE